jgi:hypothetical protein
MSYKADLYIMLPYIQEEKIDFQTIDYICLLTHGEFDIDIPEPDTDGKYEGLD